MRLRPNRITRSTLMLLATLGLPVAATAQPTVIKLATLVPDGSVWHKALVEMGDEWTRETQGRVVLRIYPGGVAGDESDMVRKMRIGQIHAAALTPLGLSDIDEAFGVFTVPGLFESYDELFPVVARMEPTLTKRLEAKGFVFLNWGHAGWVYFFSKQPVRSLADLKKLKLWTQAGDDKMNQFWKEHGYRPVPLSMTDVLTGLQTGMIDVMPIVPLGALQLQWYRTTNHMLDAGLMPLVGGLVVTQKAWNKISEADRAKVMEAGRKMETKLQKMIPDQDREALAQMQKRGLVVTKFDPQSAAAWRTETESFASKMRGTLVPGDIMDLAFRERAAYRQQHKH